GDEVEGYTKQNGKMTAPVPLLREFNHNLVASVADAIMERDDQRYDYCGTEERAKL
ncbi:unnamed protein product, partial [Amoebophrya sp. A25]